MYINRFSKKKNLHMKLKDKLSGKLDNIYIKG